MCGIAGIYNIDSEKAVQKDELSRMIQQLHHRGPDEKGFHLGKGIGLAHARLSIIDLTSGSQPIANENDTVFVVFNGEIFNYIELRELLVKRGHIFKTKSDTEVIVHLYEEYGLDFASHLNGQFAIALWDVSKKKLILVRDRVGIHPLFYTISAGRLIFGSEVKAILPAVGKPLPMSLNGLDQIFTFWSPYGNTTIFEGVMQLQPGEMLVANQDKIDTRIYWDWQLEDTAAYRGRSTDSLQEELHHLLHDATSIRLRSDVPVGAYLSGGLDSSVLTALIKENGADLRTFSIGFQDGKLDEREYQQLVRNHLGTDHSEVVCTHESIASNFPQTIWHTESPILRTAPVPMKLLSGLVHENGYKVVLTGEGADEVFGGYDIFKETKIRHFWAADKASKLRPLLLKKLYPYLDISSASGQAYLEAFFGAGIDTPDMPCFSHIPRWTTTASVKNFLSSSAKESLRGNAIDALIEKLPDNFDRLNYFCKAQYLEAKTLMATYLLSSQGDRMLMANSVEGRFPFLDHRVIEFANKLPIHLKMKALNEKYLLKRSMQKYLPDRVINRFKQPYRAPDIPSFFGTSQHDYLDEMLDRKTIEEYGYFDPNKVNLLLRKIQMKRPLGYKDNMAFVGILSTQLWHHHFVANYRKNFS